MSVGRTFRHPCSGHVGHEGFGAFLEQHLGEPRANLRAFAAGLGSRFEAPRLTLVNSGSSANLAAALALREVIGPGAHAVAAGFTFPTTASSLLAAGFSVSLADTADGGFSLDAAAARRALRPETRLLCVTHFLGFPADMGALTALAAEKGLLILQDCCEGMDLRWAGRPAHSFGTLATWSFYHPHHLSSYGGGAVVSPDEAWQRRVESISHWGRACSCHVDGLPCGAPEGMDHNFWYPRVGHNLEMSELNAAFGRFQLRTWDAQEAARRRNYQTLFDLLAGHPKLRVFPAPEGGSAFVFPVACSSGDSRALAGRLMARGVEVRSLMGGALADQPAYRELPHDKLPRCRAVAASTFFLGIHQTLPAEDVAAVGRIVAEEARR